MRLSIVAVLALSLSAAGAHALPADPGLSMGTLTVAPARSSCPWGTSRDGRGACRAFVTCAPGAFIGRDGRSCFKRC